MHANHPPAMNTTKTESEPQLTQTPYVSLVVASLGHRDVAVIAASSRVFSLPEPEPEIPRLCGLSADRPASDRAKTVEPNSPWLARARAQPKLHVVYRRVENLQEAVVGLVTDHNNEAMVVVLDSDLPGLSKLVESLVADLAPLKVRVRASCHGGARIREAEKLLQDSKIWADGIASTHRWRFDIENGIWVVNVERDERAAANLKALLGELVQVDVVSEMPMGERHNATSQLLYDAAEGTSSSNVDSCGVMNRCRVVKVLHRSVSFKTKVCVSAQGDSKLAGEQAQQRLGFSSWQMLAKQPTRARAMAQVLVTEFS